jgi:hypothetical protein
MARKPVPPVVWLLTAATGVSMVVLTAMTLIRQGQHPFFTAGDSRFFLVTARDLFGTGDGIARLGHATAIPYRYGRMGLPFAGWLLAFGRPGLVGGTLIAVNVAALTAIPGLAALLLDDNGAPPAAAAAVIALPSFLLLYGNVESEPLVIALLLLACLLDGRGHFRAALLVLAYAILVKEIAVLALVPLVWRAVRHRDRSAVAMCVTACMPYTAWCVWVRLRIGTFPFLAHDPSRTGALSLPFVGIHHALVHLPFEGGVILGTTAATIAVGAAGAWVARRTQIGVLAAIFTFLAVCLGPFAMRFVGETLRVLLVPQVFGVLALVIGLCGRRRDSAPVPVPLATDPVPVALSARDADL